MHPFSSAIGQIDCCIIWYPGLKHCTEILDKLYSRPGIKILLIQRLKSFKLRKFLASVYSQDWLPAAHISAKTNYLRMHPREALVIFYQSLHPNLVKSSSYSSSFVECQDNRSFKRYVREKFNARDAHGQLSINHVIHITDNQLQTEQIFCSIFPDLSLDSILPSDYCLHKIPRELQVSQRLSLELLPIAQLVCQTLKGSMWTSYLSLSSIESSPQFMSVCKDDMSLYETYVDTHLGVGLRNFYSAKKFHSLIALFQDSAGKYPQILKPIIVKRIRSCNYLILDGLHRASLSRIQSIRHIPALILDSYK